MTADALASDIGTFLNSRVRSGNWGAMIVSITRGDTLYSANAGDLLIPASTMKLFTAALAFDTFGPDHQFTTTVLRDGTIGGATPADRPFVRAKYVLFLTHHDMRASVAPVVGKRSPDFGSA